MKRTFDACPGLVTWVFSARRQMAVKSEQSTLHYFYFYSTLFRPVLNGYSDDQYLKESNKWTKRLTVKDMKSEKYCLWALYAV